MNSDNIFSNNFKVERKNSTILAKASGQNNILKGQLLKCLPIIQNKVNQWI